MVAKRRPVRLPRIISQFRRGVVTSGRDCGVSAGRSMVGYGSRGIFSPSAAEFRKRMGNTAGWTNPLEVRKGVNSYDKEMRRHGLKPLRYVLAGTWADGLIRAGASRRSLVSRLKRGEMIHLVVDYGRWNERMPKLSGSPGFSGLHSVWIGGDGVDAKGRKRKGWKQKRNVILARVGDSTWNRKGTPKGPQFARLSDIWYTADGVWSSRGGRGWVGGSVRPAEYLRVEPPKPEPQPCQPVLDELSALEDRYDAALEELDIKDTALSDAKAMIAALEEKRLPRALLEQMQGLVDELDVALAAAEGFAGVEADIGIAIPEAA